MATEKKKAHNRKDLTPEQIKLAGKLAGIGCNLDQIANILDIAPRTFDEILKRDEVAACAISKGRDVAKSQVMDALFNQAITGQNMTATIFYLKTRCRWAEAKSHEDIPEKGTETIAVTPENIAELCRLAREGSKPKPADENK